MYWSEFSNSTWGTHINGTYCSVYTFGGSDLYLFLEI